MKRSTHIFVMLSITSTSACGKKQEAAPTADDSKPVAATKSPSGAKQSAAKPPKTTGVAITFTVNGKATSLELSSALIAARAADAGLAAWVCEPALGTVSVVDFAIGDDPARKGELFIGGVQREGLSQIVPGKAIEARFQYRHAGEPTPMTGTGTMVWNEGRLGGTAEGKGNNGDTLSATWTCAASS